MIPPLPPAVAHAFPRRPIAVRPSRRDVAVLLGSVVIGGAMLASVVWFGVAYGPDLLAAPRIWRDGRPLVVEAAKGQCDQHADWLPFASCTVDVTAHEAGQPAVTRRLEALTFFGIDDRDDAVVKADPRDPRRWAISWYATELPLRWSALAIFSGVGLLLVAVVFGGAWALLRELRLYRALARAPQPVLAEIVSSRLVGNPDYAREVTFRYHRAGEAVRTGRQRLRVLKGRHRVAPSLWQYEEPLPLAAGSRHVLALAGAGGARLVKASFEPLALSPPEQQALRAALAATSGGPSMRP